MYSFHIPVAHLCYVILAITKVDSSYIAKKNVFFIPKQSSLFQETFYHSTQYKHYYKIRINLKNRTF